MRDKVVAKTVRVRARVMLAIVLAVALAGCTSTTAASTSNLSSEPSPSTSAVDNNFFPSAGSLCALVNAKDASGIVGEELIAPADSQAQQSTSDSCYFGTSQYQKDFELGYTITTQLHASEFSGFWDSNIKNGVQCGGTGTFEVKLGEKSTGCSAERGTIINVAEKNHIIAAIGRGGNVTRPQVESLAKLLLSRLP